jgi:serine/threonine protein kinase
MHGNLKLDNTLVMFRYRADDKRDDPDDFIHVKICDFGMARDKENPRFTGGTWTTVAPELAQRDLLYRQSGQLFQQMGCFKKAITPKADVYSCAVMIAEILIGLPRRPLTRDKFEHVWQTYSHVQRSVDDGNRPWNERRQLRLLLTKMMPFVNPIVGPHWSVKDRLATSNSPLPLPTNTTAMCRAVIVRACQ